MQHLDEGTIHAWLDGALTAGEARQAEEHVAACPACAAAVAEARGLIAASSMILSKLDVAPLATDAGSATGAAPVRDIAAARTAAAERSKLLVRHWFAGSRLKAAAAVLILAGGVAAVGRVTTRDELARTVGNAAMESAPVDPEFPVALQGAATAAQDATAAATEQAPPPPPPTVGPAPQLTRPAQPGRLGSGSGTPQAGRPGLRTEVAPTAADGRTMDRVRTVNPESAPAPAALGVVRSAAEPLAERSADAARAVAQGNATAAKVEELRQERDMSAAAKATPLPAPASVAGAAAGGESRRFADTAQAGVARQRELRGIEQSAAPQRLSPGPTASAPANVAAPVMGLAGGRADGAAAAQCYILTLTPWSPERSTIPAAPATRIVLSPDTGTAGPSTGQRLVRPLPDAFPGSYSEAWWTEVSPSTLVLTWATDAQGIVMRLVRSGEGLAGTARTFGGAAGVEQTSTVSGERIDCVGSR